MPHKRSTVHPEIDTVAMAMRFRQPRVPEELLAPEKKKTARPSHGPKTTKPEGQNGDNDDPDSESDSDYDSDEKEGEKEQDKESNNTDSETDSEDERPRAEFIIATKQPGWYEAGEPITEPYGIVGACRKEWVINPEPGKTKAESKPKVVFATCRIIPAYPEGATDRCDVHAHIAKDFDRAWISLATRKNVIGDWCFFPFVPPNNMDVPSLANGCPHPARIEVRFYELKVNGDNEANFWFRLNDRLSSTFGVISVSKKIGEAFSTPFIILSAGEDPLGFVIDRKWNFTLGTNYTESMQFLSEHERRTGREFDDLRLPEDEEVENRLIWKHLRDHGVLDQPAIWSQPNPPSVLL